MLPTAAVSRIDRLPPPPAEPVRSPPFTVAGESDVRVPGLPGGPALEARMHVPANAVRAVVICHPHPLYGGSMHSSVPLSIAKVLSEKAGDRVAWARFNFRGVEGSEGTHDDGRGEVDDVLAVMRALRQAVAPQVAPAAAPAAPGVVAVVPLSVCGHSFGSWAGLQATLRDGAVDRLLLIAPSVRFSKRASAGTAGADALPLRPVPDTTVFIGDRDELCDVDEARELADELGAHLRVFEGFDHHFLKSRRAMAEAALPVIAPEVVSP